MFGFEKQNIFVLLCFLNFIRRNIMLGNMVNIPIIPNEDTDCQFNFIHAFIVIRCITSCQRSTIRSGQKFHGRIEVSPSPPALSPSNGCTLFTSHMGRGSRAILMRSAPSLQSLFWQRYGLYLGKGRRTKSGG